MYFTLESETFCRTNLKLKGEYYDLVKNQLEI